MSVDVFGILKYLILETNNTHLIDHIHQFKYIDVNNQLEIIRSLLVQRPPNPPIESKINGEINKLITWRNNNKIQTSTKLIDQNYLYKNKIISLWKGDITTLSDVSVIVNAANSALLGCFQPEHKCIDNVIHTNAGPDLREACYQIMLKQEHEEPIGSAKITPGFNLPARYVAHTVGPTILRGSNPNSLQINQLRNCYISCLEALECLKDELDKSIAFCCISTGLFAFPQQMACEIAVDTVLEYFDKNPDSSIQQVIFNVFSKKDQDLYQKQLSRLDKYEKNQLKTFENPNIAEAQRLIEKADYLLISAGAGLSASVGLDYSSNELFIKEYQPFLKFGIKNLYQTIGFPFPTELDQWNFFLHHYINTYKKWPKTETYQQLFNLKQQFEDWFVMTTNADGFFVKNGFDSSKVLTVQGNYSIIQCSKNCKDDAYESIDGLSEKYPLTSSSQIPTCKNCGSKMQMFLRMSRYFNEKIMDDRRNNFHEFLQKVVDSGKKCVILELGVGLNTPSILRYSNEERVEQFPEVFDLIRIGIGPSSSISPKLMNKAIVIDADVKTAINLICNNVN
ncbi:uncharacterized protein KGF55_001434 [Candida pseudojiufengensis]|uniref:uncharacterized protein n=1 Tax=Candida pseudojiufengensis TaxID=497109 RepID=UPI0022244EE5|nr:uncharacterized protein KGF55_001434 [Candida pseudojiufengensis]KAI5965214.1 hypothetical protein KGF55_001434 [Candida pseudojiufengensis]